MKADEIEMESYIFDKRDWFAILGSKSAYSLVYKQKFMKELEDD